MPALSRACSTSRRSGASTGVPDSILLVRPDGAGSRSIVPPGATGRISALTFSESKEALVYAQSESLASTRAQVSSLTSRDHVNVSLREVLDEASEKWSVKVTRVEIREIDPPKSIQDSMALQMQAERERRAQVTTAEGQKQAAILKAKGEKAAKLLSAEGDRDAQIARAEGDRQSEIRRASGNAQAIATQFKAINEAGVSPQILALKYIEALQRSPGRVLPRFSSPMRPRGSWAHGHAGRGGGRTCAGQARSIGALRGGSGAREGGFARVAAPRRPNGCSTSSSPGSDTPRHSRSPRRTRGLPSR